MAEARTPWTRRQRRIYQRVQTCLVRWESQGYMVRWVMLSSSADSEAGSVVADHARLVRRIEREFGYRGIEHFVVHTREGENVPEDRRGVLHAFWAWKVPDGYRGKHFFVPQEWLSDAWLAIHRASYVWIAPYHPGLRSRGKVSRYVVSQYVGGQDALVRYFWSWRRTFGVPIGRLWRAFIREFGPRGMPGVLNRWQAWLRGESICWGRWVFDLDGLRARRVFDLERLRSVKAPAAALRSLGLVGGRTLTR